MPITKQIFYLGILENLFVKSLYFSKIEKFKRSHLQVESRHSDKKWIFCDFSKFFGAKLVQRGKTRAPLQVHCHDDKQLLRFW